MAAETKVPGPKSSTNEFRLIQLGLGKNTIVDKSDHRVLMSYAWRAVQGKCCFYAKTTIRVKGRRITIAMHRFLMRTPFGQVCHHKNLNSLDNRKLNLQNMDKLEHQLWHRNNSIQKKFAATPSIKFEKALK